MATLRTAAVVLLACLVPATTLLPVLAVLRAPSRATFGFERFGALAEQELCAAHEAVSGRQCALTTVDETTPVRIVRVSSDLASVCGAVRRCVLTHAAYTEFGRGPTAAAAVERATPHLGALGQSTWSLRALVLGAAAPQTKAERAALLGPIEDLVEAAASLSARADFAGPGSGDPQTADHASIVVVYGGREVLVLHEHARGGVVGSVNDYVPCGANPRHARKGLLDTYRTARWPHLAPTTMVPEISFLMANLALSGPGTTVLDPCAGSGSLLVGAAVFGSAVSGSDVADCAPAIAGNLQALGLAPAALLASSAVGELELELDDGQLFDAIVCDPPYGIKAEASGEAVFEDLFRVAARRLRARGRLVCMVPAQLNGRPAPLVAELQRTHAETMAQVGRWRQDFPAKGFARDLLVLERVVS